MSKGLTLLVVSAAILFDALDLSITQVALPSIQADLAISAAALQFQSAFGPFEPTPHREAVSRTVAWFRRANRAPRRRSLPHRG